MELGPGFASNSRQAVVFPLLGVLLIVLGTTGCRAETIEKDGNTVSLSTPTKAESARYAEERQRMVAEQIAARGVKDMLVLSAMRTVPRHEFVPDELRSAAYRDSPLPIGENQTISQPYIVALMTEALQLEGGEKVLEVGTGSGYQAAVLDEIADTVFSIEIIPSLAVRAESTLTRVGYGDVHVRTGDGYRGWPEMAPFDAVIVTAAPNHVPQPLLEQLAVGGRLVLPVGKRRQVLQVWTRTATGFETRNLVPVQFVPMTGEAEDGKEDKVVHPAPKDGR